MAEIIISGPEGRLEGRFQEGKNKNSPTVLILHPHPLHGGTMNNKVVYNVYKTFVDNGFSVLRFNFRGVGKSEGEYDGGTGELTDAAFCLDWLQVQNEDSNSFWISGFSFGSWIAMQLMMRRPEIDNFVAVSPPIDKYDFSFLSPCPAPGLIVQGDQDSVVNEQSVAQFADRLSKQKRMIIEYKTIFGADHFFRNHLDELNNTIDDYIKNQIIEGDRPKPIKRDRRKRQAGSE